MSLRSMAIVVVAVLFFTAAARADSDKEIDKLRSELRELREFTAKQNLALQKLLKQRELEENKLLRELAELTAQMQKERAQQAARLNAERDARLQAELQAKTLAGRNLELEARLREMARELARLPKKPGAALPPKNGDNFPAERIEGQIATVDGESKLLKLSIGSDAGLAKGHTLHIYRIDPVPEKSRYLGKIEVLEVTAKESVARAVGNPTAPILAGDRVGSALLEKR